MKILLNIPAKNVILNFAQSSNNTHNILCQCKMRSLSSMTNLKLAQNTSSRFFMLQYLFIYFLIICRVGIVHITNCGLTWRLWFPNSNYEYKKKNINDICSSLVDNNKMEWKITYTKEKQHLTNKKLKVYYILNCKWLHLTYAPQFSVYTYSKL